MPSLSERGVAVVEVESLLTPEIIGVEVDGARTFWGNSDGNADAAFGCRVGTFDAFMNGLADISLSGIAS